MEILKLAAQENTRHRNEQRMMSSPNEPGLASDFCNIVAVTAYTSQEIKDKSYQIGMKMVIPKPVTASHMSEVL